MLSALRASAITLACKKQTLTLDTMLPDVLDNMHLIRSEWRDGARWYELTHDRLIKPIKDSNRAWKMDLTRQKKSKSIQGRKKWKIGLNKYFSSG
jgi:hypothetical protein